MAGRLRLRSLSALVLAALVCAGAAGAAAPAAQIVRVAVRPVSSVEDQPVRITVRGLAAHQQVSVDVRSVDAAGIPWRSSTVFRADAHGRLDLDRAAAISGSYWRGATSRAVWGMGAIATMQPMRIAPAGAYFWGGERLFTVTVRAHGHTLGSTVFRRRFAVPAPRAEATTLAANGFVGTYWTSPASGKRPAILAFGGSEGGESTYVLGALLAAHGYPTLSLAYFGEPGLPQALSRIPLEYFARALRWLRRQPQVDPSHVLTLGASRGSEAALLLGVHYPGLVHGVVASVPANVALCSPGCGGPAWMLGGKPLPYTRQFDNPHPTDTPAAVIPVEQIRGPVFLDCAGEDQIWDSCPYAEAIARRLDAHDDPYPHPLERSPDAGHYLGSFIPYEPTSAAPDPVDEQARERLWPRLLAFLAHV